MHDSWVVFVIAGFSPLSLSDTSWKPRIVYISSTLSPQTWSLLPQSPPTTFSLQLLPLKIYQKPPGAMPLLRPHLSCLLWLRQTGKHHRKPSGGSCPNLIPSLIFSQKAKKRSMARARGSSSAKKRASQWETFPPVSKCLWPKYPKQEKNVQRKRKMWALFLPFQ